MTQKHKAPTLDEYEEMLKERTPAISSHTSNPALLLMRELCLRLRAIEWELEDKRERDTLETLK